MAINYDLARKLRDAGFPQDQQDLCDVWLDDSQGVWTREFKNTMPVSACLVPTLAQLIAACGEGFGGLWRSGGKGWTCANPIWNGNWAGSEDEPDNALAFQSITPEEAVAHLWLAINGTEK